MEKFYFIGIICFIGAVLSLLIAFRLRSLTEKNSYNSRDSEHLVSLAGTLQLLGLFFLVSTLFTALLCSFLETLKAALY